MASRRLLICLAALLAPLLSCSEEVQPQDGAVDLGVEASAPRDGQGVERPLTDGPGRPDATSDAPRLDQGPTADKGTTPDKGTTVDKGLLDTSPSDKSPGSDQVLPPDTGTTSAVPCAAGISQGTVWGANMVSCTSPSKIDQCGAEALCNVAGGWKLCTASQYKARGGLTKGSSDHGWLKACVRSNGGKPHAPTDIFCAATCSIKSATFAQVGWWCSDGKPQYNMPFADVGLISTNLCWRVGVNNASTGARWSPLAPSSNNLSKAGVCCSP